MDRLNDMYAARYTDEFDNKDLAELDDFNFFEYLKVLSHKVCTYSLELGLLFYLLQIRISFWQLEILVAALNILV